ncbi:unnamed protein product [Leuciscus chuanchicus]
MRVWTPNHFGSRQPFVQQPAPVACLPAMQLPHTRAQRDRSRDHQSGSGNRRLQNPTTIHEVKEGFVCLTRTRLLASSDPEMNTRDYQRLTVDHDERSVRPGRV